LNVAESLQIWLSGAGVSEETERVGSGPKGNSAGIDPTAVALAMAGVSRERIDAFRVSDNAPTDYRDLGPNLNRTRSWSA